MTWRHIFNTNNLGAGFRLDDVIKLVESTGYPFFCWNGNVLTADGKDIGIKVDEIEA